jgi:hypothetical protein
MFGLFPPSHLRLSIFFYRGTLPSVIPSAARIFRERSRGINAERSLFLPRLFTQITSPRSLREFATACASLTW